MISKYIKILPSLKLIKHLKSDGWNTTSFLLGWPTFRDYVGFREGIYTGRNKRWPIKWSMWSRHGDPKERRRGFFFTVETCSVRKFEKNEVSALNPKKCHSLMWFFPIFRIPWPPWFFWRYWIFRVWGVFLLTTLWPIPMNPWVKRPTKTCRALEVLRPPGVGMCHGSFAGALSRQLCNHISP